MSKRDLQLHAHPINESAWWYEEPGKLSVVVQPDPEGRTRMVEISWRKIRAALARLDKK